MERIDAADAGSRLEWLLDETLRRREPLLIAGQRANAVIISEAHWDAIQETIHLLSIPGMAESVREGLATPVLECSSEPGW